MQNMQKIKESVIISKAATPVCQAGGTVEVKCQFAGTGIKPRGQNVHRPSN